VRDELEKQVRRNTVPGDNSEDLNDSAQTVEADGEGDKKTPAADRIENTIRAFLEFAWSYARTVIYSVSPKRLASLGPASGIEQSRPLKPLTFLCCSFIPYAAVLDVSASSIWDFLFNPETSAARLADRLREASPSKILIVSLPALISVYWGSTLIARLAVTEKTKRGKFVDSMCYAFGLQFASAFLLLIMIILGHSRVSEHWIPKQVLNVIMWPVVEFRLFYLTVAAATLYPLLVALVLVATFEPKSRHKLAHQVVAAVGVIAIAGSTYWLAALPTRFREASFPEPMVSAEVYAGELAIVEEKPPVLKFRLLIKNPGKNMLLLPKEGGLSLRLKFGEETQPIPKNSFTVEVVKALSDEPFITVKPGEATWIDGRVRPDYNDWKQIEKYVESGDLMFVQISLTNEAANIPDTIHEPWHQATIRGKMPKLV
jgi:hypothetical protein